MGEAWRSRVGREPKQTANLKLGMPPADASRHLTWTESNEPMRDILIVSIVLAAALMALKRPWIGVMLWTWISIMNPHRLAYGFAYSAPVAMIAALATLIGLLATRDRQSPFKGAPVWWLFIFVIWITLTWLLGVDPAGDYELWSKVMKIYLMVFVTLALLSNKYHIMAFIWVTVGSIAFYGVKGGIFTILTGGGYRVWGPDGSFIAGNNELALALIMSIPLMHFLQLQFESRRARQAMNVAMLLCVAAALGTQSRGALVALIAMGAMFWWRSQRKGMMTIMILVVALAMIPMMPESWFDRMETIQTYEEDTSAMGRINSWIVAIDVANTHFFGAGMSYQHQEFFDTYGTYDTIVRAAHSIYFQILGNHGYIGLGLFLILFISTYQQGGWLRKNARNIPQAKWAAELGAMVQTGLVGYAAGGAFLSLPYFDLPYNMMIALILARIWVETKAWEREPKVSFTAYAGLSRTEQYPPRKMQNQTSLEKRTHT